jgi:hypothetical protein
VKKIVALALITLACSSCTEGGGGGGGGPALSRDECEALIRKGWQMNLVPFDGPEATKVFESSVQDCATDHRLYTRKEYACVMSANSAEDYAACGGG